MLLPATSSARIRMSLTHHEIQARHSAPSPYRVGFAFVVQTPYPIHAACDLLPGQRPHKSLRLLVPVPIHVSKCTSYAQTTQSPCRENDDLRRKLRAILKHNPILGEVGDEAVVLELDLAADDHFAGTGVCCAVRSVRRYACRRCLPK